MHFYHQMAMASHGVRRTGSAAIDLAYVACGRLDVFWEFGLKPWDMAAGTLLVTEAGGASRDMRGAAHGVAVVGAPARRQRRPPRTGAHIFGEIFRGHFREPIPQIS